MAAGATWTYDQAMAYIASLAPRGWRLGLDRMAAFTKAAGLEEFIQKPIFYHVAGTNGKGSTTAYMQSILGPETGAYFSPFVFDPRERWQFSGEYIPKNTLAELAQELKLVADQFENSEFGGITEFEFKTALGFAYWQKMNCRQVALEVGLGGRLDATNVVDPAVTGIVSIGLDHQNILGATIELIAAEKAGIIKPEVPVVVGQMAKGAREVILQVARDQGSPAYVYGEDFSSDPKRIILPTMAIEISSLGIPGEMQHHNAAMAAMMVSLGNPSVGSDVISRGIAQSHIPGRMQKLRFQGKSILLDGAHNQQAAENLAKSLGEEKFTLLTGMVEGHEPSLFYTSLMNNISRIVVSPIQFHRAQPPEQLAKEIRRFYRGEIEVATDIADALTRATQSDQAVLVTGSFYLVGEVGNFISAS